MARKGLLRVGGGFLRREVGTLRLAGRVMYGAEGANPGRGGLRSHPTNRHRCFSPNSPRDSHFDRVDKRTSHFDNYRHHAYRPVVKTYTFRVSRHAAHTHAVAKAERIHGVMGTYWNPRTHEMTIRYDASVTSARHIMHLVA